MTYSNKIYRTLRKAGNFVYLHPILTAFIVSGSTICLCALILCVNDKTTFFSALVKMLPLLLGELGDVKEESLTAQVTFFVGLLSGAFFIAFIGASIVNWFVTFSMKGGRIMKRVNHKNHIIICGWNVQGLHIINQLLSPDITTNRPIVLLADLHERPPIPYEVDFLSGDPTKEENLKKAGIMTADTVIILTEFGCENQRGMNPDAQAVLMTLAVESLRPDVYTCVQLFNSEYKKHLEHANVDEYICLDRMSGNMLVSSALNHGLSKVIGELLEFSSGSEIYKKEIPPSFIGQSFRRAAEILNQEEMILLAVESTNETPLLDEEGRIHYNQDGTAMTKTEERLIVNPLKRDLNDSDYIFQPGDHIYFIAVEEPDNKRWIQIGNGLQACFA